MSLTKHLTPRYPQTALRPPEQVMRLDRLGSFFPTRISFMRTLIRRLAQEKARVTRPVWDMNAAGYGRAVYSLNLGGYTYSLIAFSNEIPPEKRTDRVIAEVWDTCFNLFDGVPTTADLDRLQNNTNRQEAGRFSEKELILSRANKSLRLFAHVVESLAEGRQPDAGLMKTTGYLLRTTAVYGNGKFGIADRRIIEERPGLSGPFQAELLTVWLIRGFTIDLAEHVAKMRNPKRFVPLNPAAKRGLGIGNSTGLGMAPFLVSHPELLNNWIMARETALARVRAIRPIRPDSAARFRVLSERVNQHLAQWNVADPVQSARIERLRQEFPDLTAELPESWDGLVIASRAFSLECQELIVALLLELYPEPVNGLDACMVSVGPQPLRPAMPLAALRRAIEETFARALTFDFDDPKQSHQFWYVSEEKLEPRLGERYEEEGAELESPLDIARRIRNLYRDLSEAKATRSTAEFLMKHPEHRLAVRRVQIAQAYPYSEIQDNLIAGTCRPIDMLRCKLSYFGASKFDPKSDRWTRITMFQGAPLFDGLETGNPDDWWLPVL